VLKRLTVATAVLVATSGSVSAQDIDRYVGSFGGISLSYGDLTDDFVDPGLFATPNPTAGTASGGVSGIGLSYGYNLRRADWIVGFDVSVERTSGDAEGESSDGFSPVLSGFDAKTQGALRLRAGRVLANDMLIYGAAGIAIASYDFHYSYGGVTDTFSDTVTGGTFALGLEGPLGGAWDFMTEES
jgi:opacity protein-like surface antigen